MYFAILRSRVSARLGRLHAVQDRVAVLAAEFRERVGEACCSERRGEVLGHCGRWPCRRTRPPSGRRPWPVRSRPGQNAACRPRRSAPRPSGGLTFDHVLCGRRGVKRCTNQSSSMRFERPSIQPKHSATSTAPAQSSDATPVCFLAIRTSTSSASAPLASSQASNSSAVAKNSTSIPPPSTAKHSVLPSAAFRPLLPTGDNLDQRQRQGALHEIRVKVTSWSSGS